MTDPAPAPASSADVAAPAPRLDSLTGLRFLAALLVFFHHTFSSSIVSHGLARVPGTSKLAFAGMSGVTFFFVLSGFVLTWSWDDRRGYAGFMGRRLSRVYPLHALTFVVAGWVALPLIGHAVTRIPEMITGLLLLHAWTTKPTYFFAANFPSWSLSCELFFYALLPAFVVLARRLGRRPTIAYAVVGLCLVELAVIPAGLRVATHGAYASVSLWVFPAYRLGEFVIGAVVGWAMRGGWRPRVGWLPATGLVVVAFVFAGECFGGLFTSTDVSKRAYGNLVIDLVMVLPFTLLIATIARHDLGVASGAGRPHLLSGPVFQRLGADSFALYLVHGVIILMVAKSPVGAHALRGLIATGFALTVALLLADILHHHVERPVEKKLRGRLTAAGL